MKKLLMTAAIFTAMTGFALANSTTGVVQKWDPATRTLTLGNGMSYTVPKSVTMTKIHKGEKITLMTEGLNKHVSSVEKAEPNSTAQ